MKSQFILRGLAWTTSAGVVAGLLTKLQVQLDAVSVYSDHHTGRPRGFALIQTSVPISVLRINRLLRRNELEGRRLTLETIDPEAFQSLANAPRHGLKWKDFWHNEVPEVVAVSTFSHKEDLSDKNRHIIDRLEFLKSPSATRNVLTESISGSVVLTGDLNVNLVPSSGAEFLANYLRAVESDCRETPWIQGQQRTKQGGFARITTLDVYTDLEVSVATTGSNDPMSPSLRRKPFLEYFSALTSARVAIFGEFGSGKTTLLKTLALLCIRKAKMAFSQVPVWLPLGDYRDIVDSAGNQREPGVDVIWGCLHEYLSRRFGKNSASRMMEYLPLHLIENGIFLFDGLDDLSERGQAIFANAVSELSKLTRNKASILVAGRPHTKKAALGHEFDVLVLPPLSRSSAADMLGSWVRALAPIQGRADSWAVDYSANIISKLEQGSMSLLSERPLFLALLASLEPAALESARSVSMLYEEIISLFLSQWARMGKINTNGVATLPEGTLQQIRQALEEIAFHSRASVNISRGFRQSPLLEPISVYGVFASVLPEIHPRAITQLLNERLGLLLPVSGGFRFPHESIREYLAACYVARCDHSKDILRALFESDAVCHRETIVFTCERLARAGSEDIIYLLRNLATHADTCGTTPEEALVVAEALVGVLSASPPKAEELSSLTRRLLIGAIEGRRVPLQVRAHAADLLSRVGDSRPGVGVALMPSDMPDLALCSIPSIRFSGERRLISRRVTSTPKRPERPPVPDTLEISRPFRISKYPVSVQQYRLFVESGGYDREEFWGLEGLKWLRNEWVTDLAVQGGWLYEHLTKSISRAHPHRWHDQLRYPNRPVVGVSWFEAIAYTVWLTGRLKARQPELLGDQEAVRLPSEMEWQVSAQGGDGREWPWGNKWRAHLINTHECGIGHLIAVGLSPDSDSIFGVADMSGNSWDWTSDSVPQGPEDLAEHSVANCCRQIVVRGGSWIHDRRCARLTLRDWNVPGDQSDTVGFRIVIATARSCVLRITELAPL